MTSTDRRAPPAAAVCFDGRVELDAARVARIYGSTLHLPDPSEMLGLAQDAREEAWPLNGLRHRPEGGACGWFVWAGEELSADPDFFRPVHVGHLATGCPSVLPYLGLAPGWRFLIAPGYEDVWCDPSLLSQAGRRW